MRILGSQVDIVLLVKVMRVSSIAQVYLSTYHEDYVNYIFLSISFLFPLFFVRFIKYNKMSVKKNKRISMCDSNSLINTNKTNIA